jgi:hypothetical protein
MRQTEQYEGDYSFDDISERAKTAVRDLQPYIKQTLQDYEERCKWRKTHVGPTFALLGKGRAGKDTAAEYMCSQVPGMLYGGSSSNRLLPFVAKMIGIPETVAFTERHQHRDFWIAAGHAIRGSDLTLLARLALGKSDFAIGLRGRHEVHACVRAGIVDYTIWIDRQVPDDPTVEFTAGDCDIMIPNHGSYFEFFKKLDRFIALLQSGAFKKTKGN